MNIVHIVCRYPPYYSGMGNVVFKSAAELSKLGHEVLVLTPEYYEERELRPANALSVEEHSDELKERIDFAKRLKPSLHYGNAARLGDIESELQDADIVHLHYPFFGTANLVRKWKKRNPHKPLVITYHMDPRSQGWKGLFFKLYAEWWMPKILDSADSLVSSSLDYIQHSHALPHFKHHPEKWTEIPFGVDTEIFQPRPKPRALFEHLGLEISTPLVLFVGGMDEAHYFKGIPVFLKALTSLKHTRGLHFQAVLVGEGSLRRSYEEQAVLYGIHEHIRFVGAVSDLELPYYYNMADLFVLPSINSSEAFGMVLLEAMASGVPVLASDLPGVRSLAEEGGVTFRAGDHQDLAEALFGYFLDQENEEMWEKQVRLTAEEKYAWPLIAKRLENVYQNLQARS
ncbi:MAG: glycosyltransferase family 4 protein [Candidatus Magasanikbacteria bacterium]|nr:glycosyltransferase family 4 protein [Candidatus Magasanikbacteria bacterium]